MIKKSVVMVMAAVLVGVQVLAQAGDVAAGKAKVMVCAACHGTSGISTNPMYPNLAGQKEQYLVKQLKDFQAGTRTNPLMSSMAKSLALADIENLAAYFSSVKVAADLAGVQVLAQASDPAAGKAKAMVCAACHGTNGISTNPMYPNLAGQKEQYLVKQLKDFQGGTRTNPLMSSMAKSLTPTDIENLAAYFSNLK